jgi:uncharacterized protein
MDQHLAGGFLERKPVPSYFALTFAISWGGVLIVVGPGGFPGTADDFERLLPAAVLAMIAGPSIAGILLTGLVHGRAGLRAFLARVGPPNGGARPNLTNTVARVI